MADPVVSPGKLAVIGMMNTYATLKPLADGNRLPKGQMKEFLVLEGKIIFALLRDLNAREVEVSSTGLADMAAKAFLAGYKGLLRRRDQQQGDTFPDAAALNADEQTVIAALTRYFADRAASDQAEQAGEKPGQALAAWVRDEDC